MKRTKFNGHSNYDFYEDMDRTDKKQLLDIEGEIQTRLINIKKDSYHIGELLHNAKNILPHGSFKPWIKKTFDNDLPYSTAYFYMRLYKTFKDDRTALQYIPTEYLIILTENNFPEDTRKMITEQINNDPKTIQKKEFEQVKDCYNLLKSGTIGGSAFLKQTKDIIELGKELTDIQMGKTKHRINGNMRRPLYFGLGDILQRLDAAIEQARQMAGYFPFDPTDPEHKKLIQQINKIIEKLTTLKKELQGGEGLFIPQSTEQGNQYMSKN
ncbi:MAG: hypothetical protein WD097_09775 [Balneolales bacterium]